MSGSSNTNRQDLVSIDETFDNLYDRFEVEKFKLKDIKISKYKIESKDTHNVFKNNTTQNGIEIETKEQKYNVSNRFVKSLLSQFDLSEKVLRLFDTQTVLERIIEKEPEASFKVTVDKKAETGSNFLLLGTLKENQKILPANKVLDSIRKDPRLSSIRLNKNHELVADLNNNHEFDIDGDSHYKTLFQFNYAVDGCISPNFALGIERVVCSNGATINVTDYKSNVVISDDSGDHLDRLLKSFSNESGFQRIKNRLNLASKTPASVNEVYKVETLITNSLFLKKNAQEINRIIEVLSGNPLRQHGTTSLKTIPEDIRKTTATKLCVSDLFNIGTELTTHYSDLISNKERISKVICNLIAKPFDFEGINTSTFPIQSFYLKEFTPVTETYTDNEYTESECYEKEDFFCYSGGC
jgi:hypothetical protein